MSEKEDRRTLAFYISIPLVKCELSDVAWDAYMDQKVAGFRAVFNKVRAAYPDVAVGDEFGSD